VSIVLFVCIFRPDFIGDIFNSVYKWLGKKSGINPVWPEMGTNKELWFKGYLGIFFRFDKFGWLNWLAIPLFIYFLITIKKRERWEIALYLALCISCIFICLKAFLWERYQLTIFPLLLATIFLFGWQVFREKNRKVIFSIILFCICMLLGNYYVLKDTYAYYWRGSIGDGKPGERFPYKLIEYVNKNVEDDSQIVEWAPPILLYHASKIKKLHSQGKNKYIFIRLGAGVGREQLYAEQLIRGDGVAGYDLIYEDQGYQLYKKVDKGGQLYNDLYESASSEKSLIKNGSFESWQANQNLLPDFWHIYGVGRVQKENSDKKFGKYAVKITGDNFNFYQKLSVSGLNSENKISCFAWIKTAVPGKYRIQIYDGIDSSFSERHTGDGKWQMLRAIHTINPLAASLEIRVVQAEKNGGLNDVVYVDGVLLFPGEYYSPNALIMEHDYLMRGVTKESKFR
jgi:hypothetical protein